MTARELRLGRPDFLEKPKGGRCLFRNFRSDFLTNYSDQALQHRYANYMLFVAPSGLSYCCPTASGRAIATLIPVPSPLRQGRRVPKAG
jgi:hypothetical protein